MPHYKVIIDGKQMAVKADDAHYALRSAIANIRPKDLECRLDSPPEGTSQRVTISIAKLAEG